MIAALSLPAQALAQVTGSNTGSGASGTVTQSASNSGTGTPAPVQTTTLSNPLTVNSVSGLISNFVAVVSYVLIIVAVLAIIWTGFQFVLSRGDPKRMNELKDQLLWIVVGVAIIIGAHVIIQVIINTLSATGTVNQQVMQSINNANSGQ